MKPTKRFGLRLDWTAVPEYRAVRSGLFISLHFELETGLFFPRPDHIFRSGLRSQLTRLYGPVFFTVSKKGSGLGPDRTVASLVVRSLKSLESSQSLQSPLRVPKESREYSESPEESPKGTEESAERAVESGREP